MSRPMSYLYRADDSPRYRARRDPVLFTAVLCVALSVAVIAATLLAL